MSFILKLLGLLLSEHLFVLGLKLASELFGSPLDALDTHLVVPVALFQVTHADEDWVLHLLLLFLDLLKELRVEHLQGRRTIALALFTNFPSIGRLPSQGESYSRLFTTTRA